MLAKVNAVRLEHTFEEMKLSSFQVQINLNSVFRALYSSYQNCGLVLSRRN